ncbi:hypothetical protein [Thalassospira lucentensis]|uniref:hypothetical protein n=1 Tax=Thalassospira lucentensis TaxID=168935 RepID=UPI003AA89DD2
MDPWGEERQLRAAFEFKKCSAPQQLHHECTGKIVNAHTVPRSSSLGAIAENGHVYSFIPSFKNLNDANGVLKPQLVGTKRASTFTGFCGYHDNLLFNKLESSQFVLDAEACFLLGYRAIARELYAKEGAASLNERRTFLDKGKPTNEQIILQQFIGGFNAGVDQGLKDIRVIKEKFDDVLIKRDFSSIRAYVVELVEPPKMMFSGAWFVDENIFGEQVQDLDDYSRTPDIISASSFAADGKGYLVFQWLDDASESCNHLIDNLRALDDKDLIEVVVKFILMKLENVHLAPVWWKNMSEDDQQTVIVLMASNMNGFMQRISNVDEVSIASPGWKIKRRFEL